MTKDIIIKSNKYGINLILNPDIPFEELLAMIQKKFQMTGDFFKNAKMAVNFEGRDLTLPQEQAIVDAIMENSSIQIVCIMNEDSELASRMQERLEAYDKPETIEQASSQNTTVRQPENLQMTGNGYANDNAEATEPVSEFYRGNLRSGQVLECSSNVVLVGDVNPGAMITAGGNIVVLGSMKGNARAGAFGDSSCFIFALDMRPIQLQIGEYIAKSPDKEKGRRIRKKNTENQGLPKVAMVKDETICIEPMTKGCL